MKRRLALACALAMAALVTAMFAVVTAVEQHLRSRGFQWAERELNFSTAVWTDVTGPGAKVERLSVHPGWPIQIHLSNATLDPSQLTQSEPVVHADMGAAKESSARRLPFSIEVTDLTLSWAETPIIRNLGGGLFPEIQLSNPEHRIQAEWDPAQPRHLRGTAQSKLSHALGAADVNLAFHLGDFLQLSMETENLIAQHAFVADKALPKTASAMRLVWKPDTEEVAVEGSIGEVEWTAVGTTNLNTHNVQLRVPMTPLRSIVDLFGAQIPEAEGAEIEGEIGLNARISGPPWEWDFEPSAKGLSVSGVLPDDFGGDELTWSRNGRTRMTGPGRVGWVTLEDAGWLPEAAIAAEDIRFRTHPGFDLIAIQEALDAAAYEEQMRGGSTITQQLAKNLFLDGRRTLLRKLRELLFALNIESRMSKDAILTLYLNVVEFGPNIYGIGDASNAWFIKNPDQLSAREAAFLTSILPAPHMWHKQIGETNRPPIQRVNEVLNRMRIRGTLGVAVHRRSIQERLRVVPP